MSNDAKRTEGYVPKKAHEGKTVFYCQGDRNFRKYAVKIPEW